MTFTRQVHVQPGQPFDQAAAEVYINDLDQKHRAIYDAGTAAAKSLVETASGRPTEFGASVTVTGWSTFSQPDMGNIGLSIQISRLAPTAGGATS